MVLVYLRKSKNLISTFLGTSTRGRKNLIIEASTKTALRSDNWVMIPPYHTMAYHAAVDIELGVAPEYQLYDLSQDLSQQTNGIVASDYSQSRRLLLRKLRLKSQNHPRLMRSYHPVAPTKEATLGEIPL